MSLGTVEARRRCLLSLVLDLRSVIIGWLRHMRLRGRLFVILNFKVNKSVTFSHAHVDLALILVLNLSQTFHKFVHSFIASSFLAAESENDNDDTPCAETPQSEESEEEGTEVVISVMISSVMSSLVESETLVVNDYSNFSPMLIVPKFFHSFLKVKSSSFFVRVFFSRSLQEVFLFFLKGFLFVDSGRLYQLAVQVYAEFFFIPV